MLLDKGVPNLIWVLFYCVPGMGTIYRVKVPNAEGDVGVSQEQGCRG